MARVKKSGTTEGPAGKSTPKSDPALVLFYEPKPNPMFPPSITALLLFARPKTARRCAACGKKTKKLWTMLCPFIATHFSSFVLADGPERAALTLVCDEHPIRPVDAILDALRGEALVPLPASSAPSTPTEEPSGLKGS